METLGLPGLLAFLTSLVLSYIILPRLGNIASQIGLVDVPSRRKIHGSPKPLVGGLGMGMSLAVSCLLFVPGANLRGFYSGIILLIIAGFLDDYSELNHREKFAAQIMAASTMMYFSRTMLTSFGNLLSFGPITLGLFALPATIICTIGVINALNMIDGLDGLAGGISLIAFLSFSVLAYVNGQPELVLLSLAFSGALLAFLRYNWPPARLFMGDAGSLSIGFALAFLSIAITQKPGGVVPPVAPLLVLAMPVCDAVTLMITRTVRQRSPFAADKCHLHHVLVRFGFSRKRTVKWIVSLTGGLSLVGVLGSIARIPDYYLFLVFVLYAGMYTMGSLRIKELLTARVRLKKRTPGQYKEGKITMQIVKILGTAARILRRDPRFVMSIPISCTFEGTLISGTLLDVSVSGFSAQFGYHFEPGEKVVVELPLPQLPEKVSVTAEVVWSADLKSSRKYGFTFSGMSKSKTEMLRSYLNKLIVKAV